MSLTKESAQWIVANDPTYPTLCAYCKHRIFNKDEGCPATIDDGYKIVISKGMGWLTDRGLIGDCKNYESN